MRILWFNHRDMLHSKAGGAEKTIHEVSKRLVRMGHDVTISSVSSGKLKSFEVVDGVRINRTNGNIRAHIFVRSIIKKVNPDIIIDDLAHVIPWGSAFFTDKPVIVFFRHLHARSLPGQLGPVSARILATVERTYKFFYKDNLFVTELERGVEDLIDLGIKKENIKTILPGIDHEVFKTCDKSREPYLLYFGGLKDYKRPWLALEVLNRVSSKDIRLRIIGNGPSLEKVKTLCTELGLSDRVEFLGHLSDTELPQVLCESWINLHFSVTEGFGLTLIESSSSGTPTAALDAPGVSEVIEKYGLGLVEKNVLLLSTEIQNMFANYKEWSAKVAKSSLVFSWDKTVEQWIKILNISSQS